MKTKSLINAINKTGLKLEKGHNNMLLVKGEKHVLSFYDQEGSAICVHIQRHEEESNMMSDIHVGFFAHTIKYAIEKLLEKKSV